MKTTEKAALWAVGIGGAAALGLVWLMPGAAWWVYAIVGVVFAAMGYNAILKQLALENVANMKDGK